MTGRIAALPSPWERQVWAGGDGRQYLTVHSLQDCSYSLARNRLEMCKMNNVVAPFSYRSDKSVPSFDDTYPIAVMDGECALCTFGARLIDYFDRNRKIRICTVQSPLGQALLVHYQIDPADPESWIFLTDGVAWTSFDAWIKGGEAVGGIGNVMRIFWLLPRPIRDWIYRRIARNRIAVFGRADMCSLPSLRFRERLIGDE